MKRYDLGTFRQQFGEEKVFYNEMIGIFIRSLQEGVNAIEKALKEKDMRAVQYYVHKIISPCRHIEATPIVTLLKKMEETGGSAGEEGQKRMKVLYNELRSEAGELVLELEKEYL